MQAAHQVRRVMGIDLDRVEISRLVTADELERRAAVARLVDRAVALPLLTQIVAGVVPATAIGLPIGLPAIVLLMRDQVLP